MHVIPPFTENLHATPASGARDKDFVPILRSGRDPENENPESEYGAGMLKSLAKNSLQAIYLYQEKATGEERGEKMGQDNEILN